MVIYIYVYHFSQINNILKWNVISDIKIYCDAQELQGKEKLSGT
jgi:hypothetical protein